MKFRTEYQPDPREFPKLSPRRRLVFIGSCFADSIGERVRRALWPATVNPCGTLYNPASIAATVENALRGDYEPRLERHPATGQSFCFDFSTKFSRPTAVEARSVMKGAMEELGAALAEAGCLFVTFGTAWVFGLAGGDGTAVGNCHRLPPSLFERRCMEVDEIVEMWSRTLAKIREARPEMPVVFTVSPVRHLADGAEGNSRSKARLLLACERLAALPGCCYFPAYEILIDDLRDYRFYGADLAHPSEQAADYVMEKFEEAFVTAADRQLLAEGRKEWRRGQHRPLRPTGQ